MNLHPHQKCTRVLFSPHILSASAILAFLDTVNQYLKETSATPHLLGFYHSDMKAGKGMFCFLQIVEETGK